MTLFAALINFILGTAIGSFISVVIYRLHSKKKGIILSQSICTNCNKKLKWRHLVPIFSWLFMRGKCGYCRKSISYHYLLLELFTGLIFLITFLKWNFVQGSASIIDPEFLHYSIDWLIFESYIFYLIIFSLLTAIFFYDLKYKEIPDKISLPTIAIAIVGIIIFGEPAWQDALIGASAIFGFFLIQFLISKGKWIGGGDLRLGALMGILLGWKLGLTALIIAYIIGSIISILLLTTGKATRKTAIPFGPFLISGTLIAIFYGNEILTWYLSFLNI